MISIHQALERMMPCFEPRPPVEVPLDDALGLCVAEALTAREASPPFDNSAMDGYAVRAAELATARPDAPVSLPVAGESRAGGPAPRPLASGSAMRVFTGAPMPAGADAVVMQEDTAREGNTVKVRIAPRTGAHVRRQGEDIAVGAPLMPPGQTLGPGELGLLASQRVARLSVHRRPRVAILCTGDELRSLHEPAEPGTIVDSNAHALAAQVRNAGGDPVVLPRAPDDPAIIAQRLAEGLEADALLTVGGVSVGDHDYVHEAMSRLGIPQDFWKVAIKPGKPLSFAMAHQVPVVGLPGNPVSAMVTFEVLVRPGLRRMLGDPRPHRWPLAVHLGQEVRHRPGRLELVRVRLRHEGERLVADPHARQGSGALPSMVGADALLALPARRESLAAGARAWALPLFGNASPSPTSPFAPGGPLDDGYEDR
jgi:molybdopterin molybdotransferase